MAVVLYSVPARPVSSRMRCGGGSKTGAVQLKDLHILLTLRSTRTSARLVSEVISWVEKDF